MAGGEWLLIQELLERGDDEFVDRLRRFDDAKVLAGFAERWYSSPSPRPRELLLAYLERPLNAYRHEPLVKRLFKLAEAAGDDAVMSRLLVALDRSIRRVWVRRHRYVQQVFGSRREAEDADAAWRGSGIESVVIVSLPASGEFLVHGWKPEPILKIPANTAMPRGGPGLSDAGRRAFEHRRLFSLATRRYLRRRVWRYFRGVGKTDAARYRSAVVPILKLYEDSDVADSVALLDNWSLVHILFHDSEVLDSRPRGWVPREGRSLAELQPAPAFAEAWQGQAAALLGLVKQARSRAVRRWAMAMFDREPGGGPDRDLRVILDLLDSHDPEVVAWAAGLLERSGAARGLEPSDWLGLVRSAGPAALPILAGLMRSHLEPSRLSMAAAAELAASHSRPVALFGLEALRARSITPADAAELAPLVDAACEPIRPELLAWLDATLRGMDHDIDRILLLLDSRHADARLLGLDWFRSAPEPRGDVELWRRLAESPHDDVRIALAEELSRQVDSPREKLDSAPLHGLWASVLLNVIRGGKAKPVVVEQVAHQIRQFPEDAPKLMPLLGIGLRSLRRPERHATLAALVRLGESSEPAGRAVRAAFPELKWE
ncbi:hypothetical protein [Aquisphaera insulae]|uniref:hypothetical protein n=1 Tax=Aquisphaera insulae TaxID=2712864 RepID=UPI0013EB4806|nr:hypothetical protein [Aquisphaera insulae]